MVSSFCLLQMTLLLISTLDSTHNLWALVSAVLQCIQLSDSVLLNRLLKPSLPIVSIIPDKALLSLQLVEDTPWVSIAFFLPPTIHYWVVQQYSYSFSSTTMVDPINGDLILPSKSHHFSFGLQEESFILPSLFPSVPQYFGRCRNLPKYATYFQTSSDSLVNSMSTPNLYNELAWSPMMQENPGLSELDSRSSHGIIC